MLIKISKNFGQYFEYFVQNGSDLVEMSKIWVKISSTISSNFGRNVENFGQNLEHYKIIIPKLPYIIGGKTVKNV